MLKNDTQYLILKCFGDYSDKESQSITETAVAHFVHY